MFHLKLPNSGATLQSVASQIFSVLGVTFHEKRLSANYPEEHYYRGALDGVAVSLALSDDIVAGYPYMLWLEPNPPKIEQRIVQALDAHGIEWTK